MDSEIKDDAAKRLSAIAQVPAPAAGTASTPPNARSPAQPATVSPARLRIDARVLLAEDDAVNREVAVAMLQALGCTVEAVNNGQEAVAAVERGPFDLILMDCEMPQMDGFEATRVLRKAEAQGAAGAGALHVPIIALTGGDTDDRERCLAAGMDDHLAKPFKKAQLGGMLTLWIKRAGEAPASGAETAAAAPEAAIDVKALDNIRALQRPGAPNLLEKIIALYLDDAPKLLEATRVAFGAGDAKALRRAAHTLKSSSANLGALQLAELCGKLESQAAAESLADAKEGISRIESEYARVRASLTRQSAHA